MLSSVLLGTPSISTDTSWVGYLKRGRSGIFSEDRPDAGKPLQSKWSITCMSCIIFRHE